MSPAAVRDVVALTPAPLAAAVMLTAWALLMGCLALGLRAAARDPSAPRRRLGRRTGWPGFTREVLATCAGGYATLMAVVTGYYYGVARLGGGFLTSAAGGAAALVAIAAPVFLAASWASVRLSRRRDAGRSRRAGD